MTGRRAPQVEGGLRDVLRSHRQAVVRAKAGSALAAGSFMGGEDSADASALMSALLKAALPGDAHKDAAAAHLDAWALLASGVPDGFVADRCGRLNPLPYLSSYRFPYCTVASCPPSPRHSGSPFPGRLEARGSAWRVTEARHRRACMWLLSLEGPLAHPELDVRLAALQASASPGPRPSLPSPCALLRRVWTARLE